ncbi:LOW QUALITY PROTEIN: hypothetical protein TorRG33x02_330620 [Trema orientale]|uniref:Uncharacterized protein n=1 Tax=Trema orientale TaxID=63057 RepID=A0A2P5B6S7_TREOI|nr:LOW QUALITY PROTEIN: hypothetical protein TorRG33x02_330620 [Trema orientale]
MNYYFVKSWSEFHEILTKCMKCTYADLLICNTCFMTMKCVRHDAGSNMHTPKLLAYLEVKCAF